MTAYDKYEYNDNPTQQSGLIQLFFQKTKGPKTKTPKNLNFRNLGEWVGDGARTHDLQIHNLAL